MHENNLQVAYYMEQLQKGRHIPVVGSSDSHGTDPARYFGQSKTVVFAKALDSTSVCAAVRESYSVAIDRHAQRECARVWSVQACKIC